MKSALAIVSAAAVATLPGVNAWGDLGHETVGYVATAFLGSDTLAFVNKTLTDFSGLGPAGPWADTFKYEKGNSWSKPLHFVDAEDSAPSSCSVDDSRDCTSEGCLLSAITNYTSRLTDASLTASDHDQALKFLVHFFGDITQPLHNEAKEVGGNDIDVTFAGEDTNLHAIWDTAMPEKNIDDNYSSSVEDYANYLVQQIESGDFASNKSDWVSCVNPTQSSRLRRALAQADGMDAMHLFTRADLECPIKWSQDANTYDCSTVFDYTSGADLSGDYYTRNQPIIDIQLAKGGYRLAAWLNTIISGEAFPGSS